jgi:photosynthetic reaction center M subunit
MSLLPEYQNIFTTVQVRTSPEMGIPIESEMDRTKSATFSWWIGKIGNAQLGPIYLGFLGVASLVTFTIGFVIIGLNYWAQVDWNPVRFVLEMPWLSLDPPPPEYGLKVIPPLNDGGWWLMAGFFITASILLWWARMYRRAVELGMGLHVPAAFAAAIWLYLVLGFIRPIAMGSWSEAVPFGILSHLDWTNNFSLIWGGTCSTTRSTRSRSCSCTDRPCCSRCMARPSWQPAAMAPSASSSRSPTGARPPNAAALFWRWTMGFNASMESIHRWAWWFAMLCVLTGGIGILLTGTVVDDWTSWGIKHGIVPEDASWWPITPDSTRSSWGDGN